MKNKHKWYFKRLGNAILGREYREAYYQYQLDEFILDLVLDFIESNRSGYPATYTEDVREKKLKGVKQDIMKYRELNNTGLDIDEIEEHVQKIKKQQRKLEREIADILFNLWD